MKHLNYAKVQPTLFRVANRDNQSYMLTRDYRSNHINLTIVNNFVTKATVG